MRRRVLWVSFVVSLYIAPIRTAWALDEPFSATASTTAAQNVEQALAPGIEPIAPAPAPPPRWMVHLNFGMPVYTFLGTMGTQQETVVSPPNRATLLQLVGVGYWVLPHLRINLTMQFAETVHGIPSTVSPFTTMAVIVWAAYTNGPFFAGIGPMVAPRSYGTWDTDAGIFACAGLGVPLGAGFTLGAAVQTPFTFGRRISYSIAPAIFLSRRF